jgi:hypothetical protein
LLQLDLSFLRSQVWLGSALSEFKLILHDGRQLYEFRTSRSFKTAGKAGAASLPAATRWPLSERQSAVVHTLLQLAPGSGRLFPKLTQQAAAKTFARLGWNWCGVPRLGPHAMRTYHCWRAVNRTGTTTEDYPALASRMQVSVETMTAVYVAPSLKAPAAQLAFKLHASDERERLQVPPIQARRSSSTSSSSSSSSSSYNACNSSSSSYNSCNNNSNSKGCTYFLSNSSSCTCSTLCFRCNGCLLSFQHQYQLLQLHHTAGL